MESERIGTCDCRDLQPITQRRRHDAAPGARLRGAARRRRRPHDFRIDCERDGGAMIDSQVLERHGLKPDEYERIVQFLGREPNLTELGIFSVMWSEHCSYKSSRVHLKTLPTQGRQVLQGPGENAGAVDIGEGLAAVFRIESHNHPSFIEPYQGAATGVGGIIRDIFTMGARPIALLNSLRFGSLEDPATRRLLEGVVAGIAGYGNSIGIPTVGGEIAFEPSYSGNPLVNVFCLGIAKATDIIKGVASGVGNAVYYVGAKTGRDGIHGATMASAEFDENSAEKRPAVQVGDPFMEKLLLEACLEVMKTDALIGIQDMGAAGLTCSTCEMGSRGGAGIDIDVAQVPQRETGMTAYEIMLSESQERMLLVAQKGREEEVFRVFEKWGLDAVEVGRVTKDGKMRVLEHGEVVAEIHNEALTDDAPLYKRPLERWEPPVPRETPGHIKLGESGDLTEHLKQLLASPNICSKRYIWQQYDSMVQTNTVEGPGAGDAGVIRIKGSQRGLAMALDGNSRWCYLDPRLGAMHAVAEAARNVACTGATPVGATNCLNFGNPEKPHIMWQFSQVIDGMTKACEELEVPITGGNVSFYNETVGEGIYPTPVMGIVGILENIHKAMRPDFREPGRAILLLRGSEPGDATDAESEFGSSEYAKEILGVVWGYPPELELESEAALQQALVELALAGLLDSAHDCSEGGLAVALAECGFAHTVGSNIQLELLGLPAEFVLFGEDASRVVISCNRDNLPRVQQVAIKYRLTADIIGETVPGHMEVTLDGRVVISTPVAELRDVYEGALEKALQTEPQFGAADGG